MSSSAKRKDLRPLRHACWQCGRAYDFERRLQSVLDSLRADVFDGPGALIRSAQQTNIVSGDVYRVSKDAGMCSQECIESREVQDALEAGPLSVGFDYSVDGHDIVIGDGSGATGITLFRDPSPGRLVFKEPDE